MRAALIIIGIVLSVFIYMWQQTTATRLGYKVSHLQYEYDKINIENENLLLKINSILALEKMDKIAKEKKLNRADENSTVFLD